MTGREYLDSLRDGREVYIYGERVTDVTTHPDFRDMFWGLSDAMAKSPNPWVGDAVQPNINYGLAYRTFMGIGYPRIKEIIQQTLGSGLIYLNSHASDWKNPDVRPYLDKYVRGSRGIQAIDRVKLLWDAVGTEFAGRHSSTSVTTQPR